MGMALLKIETELQFLQVQDNYASALVALGADFSIMRIKRFLEINGGGYSQSALADLLDIPRRTLGARVKQCVEWGAIRLAEDGVHLTEEGREMLLLVHSEALKIALGVQRGFDPALVASYSAIAPDRCDPEKAISVSFKA